MSRPRASPGSMPVSRLAARLNTVTRPARSAITRPSGRSSAKTRLLPNSPAAAAELPGPGAPATGKPAAEVPAAAATARPDMIRSTRAPPPPGQGSPEFARYAGPWVRGLPAGWPYCAAHCSAATALPQTARLNCPAATDLLHRAGDEAPAGGSMTQRDQTLARQEYCAAPPDASRTVNRLHKPGLYRTNAPFESHKRQAQVPVWAGPILRVRPGPRRTGRQPRRPPGSGSRPGRRSAPRRPRRPAPARRRAAPTPRCRTATPSAAAGHGLAPGRRAAAARVPSAASTRSPAPRSAAAACRSEHADHDGQVEQAARRGPDALAVVRIDRSVGEDHAGRAGRVRGPQHGTGVAGIPDPGQQHHQPRSGRDQLAERYVNEPADREHALRRDGLRELGHHLAADGPDRGALPRGLAGQLGEPG